MNKEDYIDLIEVTDILDKMDETLMKLTGFGHGEGEYKNLDLIYEVLQRNSKYFSDEDMDNRFFEIISDRKKRAEERAELLMR